MSENHRKEYLSRIHRAQDYIEHHLAEELKLERIAHEACFSPFHFHRIFSAVTGETLYQFILRLRLEKAATQLQHSDDLSISHIAQELGFTSSSTFARAFQNYFGISASTFRKNCKAQSKQWKEKPGTEAYLLPIGNTAGTRRNTMQPIHPLVSESIEIRQLPVRSLAYLRHVGAYAGNSELFSNLHRQLFAWAIPRGHLQAPEAEVICIYHDNPDITAEEKLRISLGITVPSGTEVQPPMNLMEIAGGPYVCARYELLPHEYGAAWAYVMGEWMPASGWQPDERPSYEAYLNDPSKHPEGRCIVEIRIGVKPL